MVPTNGFMDNNLVILAAARKKTFSALRGRQTSTVEPSRMKNGCNIHRMKNAYKIFNNPLLFLMSLQLNYSRIVIWFFIAVLFNF